KQLWNAYPSLQFRKFLLLPLRFDPQYHPNGFYWPIFAFWLLRLFDTYCEATGLQQLRSSPRHSVGNQISLVKPPVQDANTPRCRWTDVRFPELDRLHQYSWRSVRPDRSKNTRN